MRSTIVSLVLSVLVVLGAAASWPSGTAVAAPTAGPGEAAWQVRPSASGWTVTWRSPEPIGLRDDEPVLVADGVRLGPASLSSDARTLTVVTTDPRVRSARRVSMGWSRSAGPNASTSGNAAAGPVWGTDHQGPVLDREPSRPGPYRTATLDYDLGDRAVTLPVGDGVRAELRGRVHHPQDARGHRPVVVFLHGAHSGCYDPDAGGGGHRFGAITWPCSDGEQPVRSYLGYERLATALASQGYVVVSVSADGLNNLTTEEPDRGRQARSRLVLATLDLLRRADAGRAPALAGLRGRLDLDDVGLMGHSRGGEGVVAAAIDNTRRRHPYGIRGLFLLAPTDVNRLTLPPISTAVVLPHCDGDVGNLEGQKYLDDTDLVRRDDPGFRSGVLVMGANHNNFNTRWADGAPTGSSDGAGSAASCDEQDPSRLSLDRQQQVGRTYVTAFFRIVLGRDRALLPLFDGSGTRAPATRDAVVRTTYTAPARHRRDLETFAGRVEPGTARGGAQLEVCAGQRLPSVEPGVYRAPWPTSDATHPVCSDDLGPFQASHWTPSPVAGFAPGTPVGHLRWSSRTGRVDLPLRRADRDLTGWQAVSLLASPAPGAARTDLSVRLVDGRGRSASVPVSSVSDALTPLPGTAERPARLQLRAVRVPLGRFRGIDLRDVRAVQLRTDRTARGDAYVSALALVRTAPGRSAQTREPLAELLRARPVPEGPAGTTSSATMTVRLSRPTRHPVTVGWSAAQTEGVEGPTSEREPLVVPRRTGQVTVPAGRRTATFRVPVRGDDRYGALVEASVGISRARGALLGTSTGTVRVENDDPAPRVTVGPGRATEGDDVIRFGVRLSTDSDLPVNVVLRAHDGSAVRGRDWEVPAGADAEPVVDVFVAPGEVSGAAELEVLDDATAEPTESLTVEVVDVGGGVLDGPTTLAGTLVDDDRR